MKLQTCSALALTLAVSIPSLSGCAADAPAEPALSEAALASHTNIYQEMQSAWAAYRLERDFQLALWMERLELDQITLPWDRDMVFLSSDVMSLNFHVEGVESLSEDDLKSAASTRVGYMISAVAQAGSNHLDSGGYYALVLRPKGSSFVGELRDAETNLMRGKPKVVVDLNGPIAFVNPITTMGAGPAAIGIDNHWINPVVGSWISVKADLTKSSLQSAASQPDNILANLIAIDAAERAAYAQIIAQLPISVGVGRGNAINGYRKEDAVFANYAATANATSSANALAGGANVGVVYIDGLDPAMSGSMAGFYVVRISQGAQGYVASFLDIETKAVVTTAPATVTDTLDGGGAPMSASLDARTMGYGFGYRWSNGDHTFTVETELPRSAVAYGGL